jgi:hypothetical protein
VSCRGLFDTVYQWVSAAVGQLQRLSARSGGGGGRVLGAGRGPMAAIYGEGKDDLLLKGWQKAGYS